ncbi:lactate utilization protein [Aliarcobacter butzleri]|uniref:Lactate utilization protein n=1 Tax=Aliarcobacter butzleri TaxID=28197 RepID=A0AAP4PZ01_9BACT|nr:lactate utilization protein [Aliarcobacter butzleri]MBF7065800.1 lactate utilization protein [Aliarcobacter butzleri]MCG3703876.1 lactate utilization protein [Aliarcobacter butzleri]MCG3712576.1 lactate utilization protein [Aliarcobacter butzleri]MCG3715469.1 lactate utilization protein [Aliarcobacter butzleri]MCT7550428.1 lactate utilization protein [Aliarcobacter butzleri]
MKEFLAVLKSCGYDAYFVKDKAEALSLAKSYIKPNMSVGLGGSESVKEIGLLDFLLENKEITLHNQYEAGISMEENIKRRKQGLISDIFVTSTNAITRDGKLVNADGSGNRVAALSYGPTNVLLIVGINKIVDSLEDGFKRVMDVAATKNIDRMNKKAISFGKEPKYNLDNIARKFSWIKADDEKGRIIIILVDEELGY